MPDINTYKSKYAQIITDETQNALNMTKQLTLEEYYDLLHHTHNLSDILGSAEQSDELLSQVSNKVQEVNNQITIIDNHITNINNQITALQNKLNTLNTQLDNYIDEDFTAIDWDATTPGIQDFNGNTINPSDSSTDDLEHILV